MFTDIVLDIDQFGDIIGLEVIGFGAMCGIHEDISEEVNNMCISYDVSSDAMALCLKEGRSFDQFVVEGHLIVNSLSQLVQVELMLPKTLLGRIRPPD